MMTRMMIAATALLMAGCATADTELDMPRAAGDTIRFTAGRCLGACPAYSVQVTPDGSGLLEPEKFTAVPGPTRFTVTPAQYRQLRAALAPYKPPVGTERRIAQGENCTRFATDMPGYRIEWTGGKARPTRLDYQSGCMDARYGKLRSTISGIPKWLGIEPMLKAKAAQ